MKRNNKAGGRVSRRAMMITGAGAAALGLGIAAADGPDANVMGAFQLTDVAKSRSLKQVIADWEVGKANAFGKPGTKVTLTAFVVSGTAPGIVKGSVHPISNVVRESFWIGK